MSREDLPWWKPWQSLSSNGHQLAAVVLVAAAALVLPVTVDVVVVAAAVVLVAAAVLCCSRIPSYGHHEFCTGRYSEPGTSKPWAVV